MKLLELLDRSSASLDFARAIRLFLESGRPNNHVRFAPGSPPVKIERTLAKLLESDPDLCLEAVEIDGRSGCEFFRGTLVAWTDQGERRITFDWDCRWKAEAVGWKDYFGFPDQIRAAREFGHDCFRGWSMHTDRAVAPAGQIDGGVVQGIS